MSPIPYAFANDDGSVTCPACRERIAGVDESQCTPEDAITKGASKRYAQHYAEAHPATVQRLRMEASGALVVEDTHATEAELNRAPTQGALL